MHITESSIPYNHPQYPSSEAITPTVTFPTTNFTDQEYATEKLFSAIKSYFLGECYDDTYTEIRPMPKFPEQPTLDQKRSWMNNNAELFDEITTLTIRARLRVLPDELKKLRHLNHLELLGHNLRMSEEEVRESLPHLRTLHMEEAPATLGWIRV